MVYYRVTDWKVDRKQSTKRGFQDRNPQLRVFSAHLHMDEATPHLHIDFVPFTTESRRGLETRVSLKQALAKQGFKGKGRDYTEWEQWVQSEKEHLAVVMERYEIEWEHKGVHEKHLSVLDYKKQEREKEIIKLDDKIAEKKMKSKTFQTELITLIKAKKQYKSLMKALQTSLNISSPNRQRLCHQKVIKQSLRSRL